MANLRVRALAWLPVLAVLPALTPACGEESTYPGDGREPIGSVSSEITKATRIARYKLIKSGAAAKGIPSHGYMLAGIAYHESAGLCQCQAELTWACQGPGSPDCNGGAIMAGAGDGPCSSKQGGLGIFQFDAGTHAQTIAAYGKDVLTIEGGTQHAVAFVLNMVKKSAYTNNADTDAKALAWINKFDPNNKTLRDQWIKTILRYYNGCQPSWSCWSPRYAEYNNGLSTVLGETGLAFWAPAAPPPPVDNAPKGTLEKAGCDVVSGWAQDPDQQAKSIAVKVFFDGPLGKGREVALTADEARADLEKTLGSKNHGFTLGSPFSLFDGKLHEVHAYGIDANGTKNAELAKSPGKLSCPTKIPAGVARWIKDPATLKAWSFDLYFDQLPANKVDVDKIVDGTDLPGKPVLQQADGDTAVYLVDGTFKHHVTSSAVLEAWRMGKADVQKKTKAEIAALETAGDLRARPVLVADSTGRILLLDDPLPGSGAGGSGSGGAPSSGGSPGSAGAGGEGEAGGGAAAGGQDNDAGAGGKSGDGGKAGGGKASGGKAGGGGAVVGTAGKAGQGGKPPGDEGAPVNVAAEPGADGACSVGGQGGLLLIALAGMWGRRRGALLGSLRRAQEGAGTHRPWSPHFHRARGDHGHRHLVCLAAEAVRRAPGVVAHAFRFDPSDPPGARAETRNCG